LFTIKRGSARFSKIKRQLGLPIFLVWFAAFAPPAFLADNDMFLGLSLVFRAVKVFRDFVNHFYFPAGSIKGKLKILAG
jgi:hypothetical protein